MYRKLSFLLLQVRNAQDPMRQQEVGCFAQTLKTDNGRIQTHDLLSGQPTKEQLKAADVVLIGGSGDYSVAEGGEWLNEALETMMLLVDSSKPTFGSCWGFQAIAKALGGTVVTDLKRAELGTINIELTPAGKNDPVFGQLNSPFMVQIGHQEIVDKLPAEATRLASSEKVENEAFCITGKPIYCTQFHPELTKKTILERVVQYPKYVNKILGMSMEDFARNVKDTPEQDKIMPAFIKHIFGS